MWGKRTREKQTVPQQFLNTCDYFQHKTQTEDVCTYNRVMQNWNVRYLYRVSRKDIIVQWNLLYMKPSKDNMQEKSEYESLYDSAGNEGYMVCILSRRKSSIADYWNYFMLSENVHSFFFYSEWVLSTNNFLFLLITPVNSGSTIVNIKG